MLERCATGLTGVLVALFYFDIPAGSLYTTVGEWKHQTETNNVSFVPAKFAWGQLRSPAVHGLMTAAEGLRLLLPAGYTFDWVDHVPESDGVVVFPIQSCQPQRGVEAPLPPCWGKALSQ